MKSLPESHDCYGEREERIRFSYDIGDEGEEEGLTAARAHRLGAAPSTSLAEHLLFHAKLDQRMFYPDPSELALSNH